MLSKLVRNQGDRSTRTNNNYWHAHINEHLDKLLANTLDNIGGYTYIDLVTAALSLAKVVKQVDRASERQVQTNC